MELTYDLFAIDETGRHLVESAPASKPFEFITGFATTLKAFEQEVIDLEKGDVFDFTLTPEQAYGQYDNDRLIALERELFCVNGRFDHENIYIDAIVPFQNQEGDQFMGRIVEIRDISVIVDLNHPLAGKSLNFCGTIIESREATEKEIHQLIRKLTNEDCEDCLCCNNKNCGK